jgi:hypothetical protein
LGHQRAGGIDRLMRRQEIEVLAQSGIGHAVQGDLPQGHVVEQAAHAGGWTRRRLAHHGQGVEAAKLRLCRCDGAEQQRQNQQGFTDRPQLTQ